MQYYETMNGNMALSLLHHLEIMRLRSVFKPGVLWTWAFKERLSHGRLVIYWRGWIGG